MDSSFKYVLLGSIILIITAIYWHFYCKKKYEYYYVKYDSKINLITVDLDKKTKDIINGMIKDNIIVLFFKVKLDKINKTFTLLNSNTIYYQIDSSKIIYDWDKIALNELDSKIGIMSTNIGKVSRTLFNFFQKKSFAQQQKLLIKDYKSYFHDKENKNKVNISQLNERDISILIDLVETMDEKALLDKLKNISNEKNNNSN